MDSDRLAYEAFLQGDEYYLNEWEQINETGQTRFNWYAFFFGMFWLLYRKMYSVLLLLLGALFIQFTLEEIVFSLLTLTEQTQGFIANGINLINALLIGSYANKMYLWDANRKIKRLGKSKVTDEAFYLDLFHKGGITFIPLIIIASVILAGMLVLLLQNN